MDLQEFAGKCAGARQLDEDRIRFDCPLDPTHTAVARRVGDRLVLVCFENCERGAIIEALGLGDADLTITTGYSPNGHASAPASPLGAVSDTQAVPVAYGVPEGRKPRDPGNW